MVTVEFVPTGATPPERGAYLAHLGVLLDAPVKSGADLVALALDRLDVGVIDRLTAQGLKWEEISFIIARRTLTHRRDKHEPLTADESDKAIRLAKLLALASSTFGDDRRGIE